jgi:hypothetical protein
MNQPLLGAGRGGEGARTHGNRRRRVSNLPWIRRRKLKVCNQRTEFSQLRAGNREKATYTSTAFISLTAIVLPIQPCGPAMKENCEKIGL